MFKTTDTRRRFEITLRQFQSSQGWLTPDIFEELEETSLCSHYDDEAGAYLVTQSQLDDAIDWWEDEVATANRGDKVTDCLTPLTEEEIEDGVEFVLTVEETEWEPRLELANAQTIASSLYDGGWRAADREDLIEEYDLSEENADIICDLLVEYAEKESEAEEE